MARALCPATRAGVAVVAALVTVGAAPASLRTSASPRNGLLTVVAVRPPSHGLVTGDGVFFVAPDGRTGRWLAGGGALEPSWSPNGKSLLFTRKQEQELWLADGQGRHATKIASGGFGRFSAVDWSPNGLQLVLLGERGIELAQRVGRQLEPFRLAVKDPSADVAAVSPTAPQIAYRSDNKLVLTNTDGSDAHVLATSFRVSAPSWAPDGTTIAFTRCIYQQPAWLSLVDPDGSNLRDVVQLPRNSCGDPSVSPDGSAIAFAACPKGDAGRVSVVDRDGSNLRDVARVSKGACPGQIVWSPDGALIAFTTGNRSQHYSLEVAAADGTSQRVILQRVDGCCRISWQRLGA